MPENNLIHLEKRPYRPALINSFSTSDVKRWVNMLNMLLALPVIYYFSQSHNNNKAELSSRCNRAKKRKKGRA